MNKIYAKESVVRESKIRKWLIYLTLFIASLVIIGDLVSTINTLLGGEITIRFILKAISILFVAALIFGYYLNDVRKNEPTKLAKYFAFGSGVLILIGIISAFFVVGSPNAARLVRFDREKVSDLQTIQYNIVSYWQGKEVLPKSLSDLTDSISSFKAPSDPQTNVPYEYYIVDEKNLSFNLCATFNGLGKDIYSQPMYPGQTSNQNWDHPAGRFCFERTIDKQLYPPLNKTKQ